MAVVVGAASVLVLPVAVFLTRYSDAYDLLHAGFAIPAAAVLGWLALSLARTGRRRASLTLRAPGGLSSARAGRALGLAGVWLAGAAVTALAVYGLLEYIAST